MHGVLAPHARAHSRVEHLAMEAGRLTYDPEHTQAYLFD